MTPITESLLFAAGYEKRQTPIRPYTNIFFNCFGETSIYVHEAGPDGVWPCGLFDHRDGNTVGLRDLRFMEELTMLETFMPNE